MLYLLRWNWYLLNLVTPAKESALWFVKGETVRCEN
jgi:hypothetical protein